jgi:hypothetical protein
MTNQLLTILLDAPMRHLGLALGEGLPDLIGVLTLASLLLAFIASPLFRSPR